MNNQCAMIFVPSAIYSQWGRPVALGGFGGQSLVKTKLQTPKSKYETL